MISATDSEHSPSPCDAYPTVLVAIERHETLFRRTMVSILDEKMPKMINVRSVKLDRTLVFFIPQYGMSGIILWM